MAARFTLLKLLVLSGTIIGIVLASSPALARDRVANRLCDPEAGDAVRPDVRALNRLKNRGTAPIAQNIDRTVSLAAMLRPDNDASRWDDHKAAQLVGFVADVKVGGIESVNCHARSVHGRDTHIDLTLSGADAYDERRHVIVEITPRWRADMASRGLNWETDALQQQLLGRCVKVTGWLLFDAEHRRQSQNTAVAGAKVWRATAWEIHPITEIEALASCTHRS